MSRTYRRRPVLIEACQFTLPLTSEFLSFCGHALGRITHPPGLPAELELLTLEDGHDRRVIHIATEGDYIIRGVANEFHACKPDIFSQTYEEP